MNIVDMFNDVWNRSNKLRENYIITFMLIEAGYTIIMLL